MFADNYTQLDATFGKKLYHFSPTTWLEMVNIKVFRVLWEPS